MKCCDMHSGLLRSQISIERETLTPDGMGGNTSAWAADPAEGVWANWKGYKGTAQFNSEESHDHRDVALNRFRAVIHFRGDAYGAPYYTEGDRVVYKNRTYNIESILDVEDRQQWLEMTLVEGRPS